MLAFKKFAVSEFFRNTLGSNKIRHYGLDSNIFFINLLYSPSSPGEEFKFAMERDLSSSSMVSGRFKRLHHKIIKRKNGKQR